MPTRHVLTHTNKTPPNNRAALIVRLTRTDGSTLATIESRSLKAGNWVTQPLLEERAINKAAALRLATDLAEITGIQDVYIVQGPDVPR